MIKNFALVAMALLMSIQHADSAAAQFDEVTKWIPDNANMIVLVRNGDIFASEVATQNGWEKAKAKAFEGGASKLPPTLDKFLIASQLDLQFMESVWQVAVFEEKRAMDMVEVSKKTGGSVEMLGTKKAISFPNDSYLVQVDSKTIAAMSPANRQMAARWVINNENSIAKLSDYLSAAVKFADKKAHIIAAIDFEHAITAEDAMQRVKDSGEVAETDIEKIAAMVASLRGVTLGVTFNDSVTGALKVDFSDAPGVSAEQAKAILSRALKENGLFIDDLNDWKATLKGNQLLLLGKVSTSGLRQIGMLIEQPLAADYGYEDEVVDEKTRSIKYFKSVESLVSELRDKKSKSLKAYARWFERYARQIDELSVRGVDKEVTEFGQDIADGFRNISGVLLTGEYGRMNAREDSYGYTYNYRGYRRYYGNYNYGRRSEGRAKMKGGMNAQEIMRALDSQTAKLRKSLNQKYDMDF